MQQNKNRPVIRSRLSFQPLLKVWKEMAESEQGHKAKLCLGLIEKFSGLPALLLPIDDYNLLEQHQELIEEAITTIFPISLSRSKALHAISVPFSYKIIYSSPMFKKLYQNVYMDYLQGLNPRIEENIAKASINLAYKMILKKYYKKELLGAHSFICAYPEPEQEIYNYFELEWGEQFIEINTNKELPSLPQEIVTNCVHVDDLSSYPELFQLLPLDQFLFEGILLINMYEVTEKEALKKITQLVKEENFFKNTAYWSELEEQIRYMVHLPQAEAGFTIFDPSIETVLSDMNLNSRMLKTFQVQNQFAAISEALQMQLQNRPYLLLPSTTNNDKKANILKQLEISPYKIILILPLKINQQIVGCMEIFNKEVPPYFLTRIYKLFKVSELLQNAIHEKWIWVQSKVSQMVKEHFTSIHPSVEWKFKETALEYFITREKDSEAAMNRIIFKDVYPLYAAIDIKNSSGERNLAVQQDMIQQLQMIKKILIDAKEQLSLGLLEEIEFRVNEYIAIAFDFFTTVNERNIRTFLKDESKAILKNLQEMIPALADDIETYFKKVDNRLDILNSQQQKFENSVSKINSSITRFMEKEQVEVQKIFPHYYQHFVTDGVEFNMYIGQSIVPGLNFNKLYLKNLRLWQLTHLIRIAQLNYKLQLELDLPLQTTQLVLSYNEPISIEFRTDERKFDVEGTHSARYEVIKKRIDKVYIKDSNERLVKVGTLAIVYSSGSEAREYSQYIKFLRKQHLLTGEIERLELESLQGVDGLKALRVNILFEDVESEFKLSRETVEKSDVNL